MQKTSESKLEVVEICGFGDWPGSQLISPCHWRFRANNHHFAISTAERPIGSLT
jgi:hypothetical protein